MTCPKCGAPPDWRKDCEIADGVDSLERALATSEAAYADAEARNDQLQARVVELEAMIDKSPART